MRFFPNFCTCANLPFTGESWHVIKIHVNQGTNISKCNNDRQWSVYCFKIKGCQIQVLYNCRICDGNNTFVKIKNPLKMEYIYLNWKRKLEAKLTQYSSSSIESTAFIFKQSIPIHRSGNLRNKCGTANSVLFTCTQLAFYALNPHFSGRSSRICVKGGQTFSILGAFFFCVTCILRFLGVFLCFHCESLIRNVAHASLSSFLGARLSYFLQDLCLSFFKAFLTGLSVKMTVVFFFLFTFWLFLVPALGGGRMSSGEEGCVSSFEVDIDGPGELIDVFGGSCYCWKLL